MSMVFPKTGITSATTSNTIPGIPKNKIPSFQITKFSKNKETDSESSDAYISQWRQSVEWKMLTKKNVISGISPLNLNHQPNKNLANRKAKKLVDLFFISPIEILTLQRILTYTHSPAHTHTRAHVRTLLQLK